MSQARLQGSPLAHVAAERIAGMVQPVDPGTRLGTKSELRQGLGVSVGTFNEALRLLQSRGLVTVRSGPGGGIFTATQSPIVRLGNSVLALDANETSVADAVRLRNALDPLLVADAVRFSSASDVTAMRDPLELMARATETIDATAFARANWRLHARIAAVSPSAILRSFYSTLLEIIETHTMFVIPVDQPPQAHLQERYDLHAALVDAIEARDAAEAQLIIEAHNTNVPGAEDAIEPATPES
jgi:DNA-binding FadR family transcriptional regulator